MDWSLGRKTAIMKAFRIRTELLASLRLLRSFQISAFSTQISALFLRTFFGAFAYVVLGDCTSCGVPTSLISVLCIKVSSSSSSSSLRVTGGARSREKNTWKIGGTLRKHWRGMFSGNNYRVFGVGDASRQRLRASPDRIKGIRMFEEH